METLERGQEVRLFKLLALQTNYMPKKMRDHIEKPEDKVWKDWFTKLKPEDHEHYLEKLGLGEDDLDELPAIETQLHEIEGEAKPQEKDLSETLGRKADKAPVSKTIGKTVKPKKK